MTQALPQSEVKPLTLWEKIKTGVKGCVKSVADYLPRGLMISALFVGGMAVAGNMGFDPFNMGLQNYSGPELVNRIMMHGLIGSVIAGGIGTYSCLKEATQTRAMEISAQSNRLQRGQGQVPERQQEQEYTAGFVPQSGLPMKPLAANKTLGDKLQHYGIG